MTIRTSKLRDAITFALVVGATTALGTGVAFAQEQQQPTAAQEEAATLDTVVVTGTRIQSQTVTASAPVTEIQKEEFQYSGATRTEDLVNQYPQLSPTFDSFNNNGATGYPTVNLRGLGASRTLTLVNGFRLPPGAFESRDISIVPSALVSRVDILTGGASAVYGSDAVAGVVNFILDDEFEGVSLTAGYSAYQHENDNEYIQGLQAARGFPTPDGDSGFDGVARNFDLVVGGSFADGQGHATAWATWRKNDPLFQGQRDYSACALNAAGTACGGSATNAAGNFYIYQLDADGEFLGGTGASQNPDGSFRTGYGAPYNYAPINYYQRPDERYTFGSTIKYEINEHFRPYVEAMFVNKRSSIQVAESGAFFTALPALDCANPIIGSLCADLGFDPANPVNIYVAKRNVEGGPRRTDNENTQYRIVTGVEGDLGEGWAYNASFLYGQTASDTQGFNDFLSDRIVDAILGCPDGSFPGCIPYNVFTPGGVTPAAAAALAGVSFEKVSASLRSVNAYVTGDTGFGLPWVQDGNVNVVFGTEWREETYDFNADTNSREGNFAGSGGPSTPISGKTSVSEIFMEAAVPLLRDVGFVDNADLELGYRLSDYDRSGRANTWKVALAAEMGDYRVRTGFNHAIRAPNIGDLFDPQAIALFGGADPCAGATPTLTPAQCVNTGVPLDRYGTVPFNPAAQYNQFTGGNPNLAPESADTFTFGVVATPIRNLQLNADYFDIKIEDTISTIGANTILQFCGVTGDPFLCNRIQRNPVSLDLFRGNDPATSGLVINTPDNFGEVIYRGIDLGANYRWEMLGGRFSTSINGTYLMEEEYRPLPGVNEAATYDCAGKISTQCQSYTWRHIASLRYARDWFSVNLRWRYFGELAYEDDAGSPLFTDKLLCPYDASQPARIPAPTAANPARTVVNPRFGCLDDSNLSAQHYFDISATAAIGAATEVTIGVNNFLDKEPPLVGATLANNGNAPFGYDQAGRYIFGSVTFRF